MRQPQASSTTLQGVGPTETKDAAPDLELAPQAQPIDPEPHRASPNRVWLWLALITLAVGTALVLWRMSPNPPGDLVVSVAGPSSQAIPKLELLVDDELRCTYSPCRISGLSEGVHVLRARAPGYVESAPRPLLMTSGTDLTQNLVLSPVPARASLSISARGTNLTITVDDEERGAPPVEVSDLEPGEHRIVVSGPRFEALTERVVLGPGERRGLGPFAPKVKTGSLSVRLGANAEGASVELDGQPLRSLPHQAELAANRPHTLRAEKTGFDRFEREIVFPDGKAELDVEIVLLEAAGDEAQQESTAPASADASAPAVLSMNSIPASKITLDGKALGSTPRRGVKVRAGQHQIVFVHPQRGKKSVSIRVRPGEKRNVSVRF